jgi:hypothetical protein
VQLHVCHSVKAMRTHFYVSYIILENCVEFMLSIFKVHGAASITATSAATFNIHYVNYLLFDRDFY